MAVAAEASIGRTPALWRTSGPTIGNVAAPEVAVGEPRRAALDRVWRLLAWMGRIGVGSRDHDDDRLRHGTMILASVFVALLSFVWVGTYLSYGYPVAAAIPAAYQLVTVAGLVLLSRTRRFDIFCTTQLTVFVVLPALLQVSLGGFRASSGVILWGALTALTALTVRGVRGSVPWALAVFTELVVLGLLDSRLSGHAATLPTGMVVGFFVLNIIGVTLSAYVMLAYFVDQRNRAHLALAREQERSERLLLNVLPASIAEQLKGGGSVIAEHHDEVTVLFADLVGFTERSASMEPRDLVTMLDRIFTAFDQVAQAEGVEKIKTIGDAYMLVGGVPTPRPDHLEAVARSAIAMRDALAVVREEAGLEWLDVRIGIDSGPVVAGVIGRSKFIYDLWGDTVNTASRMESHGVPGEIQVTERVAGAIGPEFVVRPRGVVEVKGKGPMRTWLLDAARAVA
jgi:guanylate cyclase